MASWSWGGSIRGKWVTPLARTVYPLDPANCNIWKKMMIQIWGLVCCPTTCRSLFEDHFGPSLTMSMCGATDLTDRTASPIRINQKVAWTRHNFWHNVGNTFLMLLVSTCLSYRERNPKVSSWRSLTSKCSLFTTQGYRTISFVRHITNWPTIQFNNSMCS